MKNFKQGINEIKQARLTPEEKGRILKFVLDRAENMEAARAAAREEAGSRRIQEAEDSLISRWVRERFLVFAAGGARFRFAYSLAGLLVILLAGGSAASAAEGALPGEPLYPIKIYVNEPIRGALLEGDTTKAEWEAEKAIRRLKEAETLAARGNLDDSKVKSITANFEKSTNNFAALMDKIQLNGGSQQAVEVSVDFESKLNAHAYIVSLVDNDTSSSSPEKKELSELSGAVRAKAERTWESRKKSEDNFLRSASVEGRENSGEARQKWENKADKVRDIIMEAELNLNLSTTTDEDSSEIEKEIIEHAHGRLESAWDALIEARVKSDSGDDSEAYSSLIDSERAAKEASASLKQGMDLRKDWRENKRGGRGGGEGGEDKKEKERTRPAAVEAVREESFFDQGAVPGFFTIPENNIGNNFEDIVPPSRENKEPVEPDMGANDDVVQPDENRDNNDNEEENNRDGRRSDRERGRDSGNDGNEDDD